MKKFLRLKKYFRQYRWSILAGFVCLLLTNIVSLAAPWILKKAIDSLNPSLAPQTLLLYAALIVGVTVIQGVFRFFSRLILIGASRRIEYDFRNDILEHLQRLPWAFFSKNKTGDIMTRVSEDLSAVRMALGPGFMHFFNTLVLFLAAGGLLFYINPQLAFFALLPLPLLSFMIRTLSRRLYRHFRAVQEQLASISTRVQENFAGIRIIKIYLQEEAEVQAIRKLGQEYVHENLRLARLWGFFMPLMMFTSGLGMVIVLWLGGRQVIQGSLTLGEFVAFNSYLAMLILPMMAMGWVINLFQRGAASLDRIAYILDEPPQANVGAGLAPARPTGGHKALPYSGQLEFRNLSFAYEEERWILKDINLVIPAGSTLGIVGPVGAGKTTLANLIPRLLETTKGELSVDGVELQKLPLKQLRRLVGYVPQESFLFSTSLKENILYGLDNRPPDSDEMERVFQASGMAELLREVESFPEKFETRLGERGVTLSGGQRQRTALARALIMEPKILILDDAFASVDTFTEGKILAHLKPFMAKRTCIIISHRISTLKHADLIIVLQDGRITEQGRHEKLLQGDGFYAQVYRKQLLLEEIL